MTIGSNIGKILLDMAQTAIKKGEPINAVETYIKCLPDFTEEYAIQLLQNKYVLITNDNVSVKLTDDEIERSTNEENITDWQAWVSNKLKDIEECVFVLSSLEREFNKRINKHILDHDISEDVISYFGRELSKNVGVHNIAAKLIVGNKLSNLQSNEENIWNELCAHVEDKNALAYEYSLYFTVKYVNNIRTLHKEYLNFIASFEFLMKNRFIDKPKKIETILEGVLDKLFQFSHTSFGYYHPICNTKLYQYKEQLSEDIFNTIYGKEYKKHHILEKNIMDGYDAGWLSPEGKFYGEDGPTSAFIHLRIADLLCDGDIDGDIQLETKGWLKIHGNDVFGNFIGLAAPTDDFPYAYCPTEEQIKLVCAYLDKYHNGKCYTQPQIVRNTDPISTYKLKQMDKFKLHELFS